MHENEHARRAVPPPGPARGQVQGPGGPVSTPDATDLRIAALSDRKHGAAPEGGLLNMLLPDIPGVPYGGNSTPEQRAATVAVTRLPLPASARPADLRAALRAR